MLLALLATAALGSEVAAEGMTLAWTVEDGVLEGRVTAPATGWVGVGFNDADALAGSVLILGFADGERSVVEEHIARPPEHPRRTALGGTAGLLEAAATEVAGTTTVVFRWRLDTGDDLLSLEPGQSVFVTLAYSHHDDLQHHSAMRTRVPIRL